MPGLKKNRRRKSSAARAQPISSSRMGVSVKRERESETSKEEKE